MSKLEEAIASVSDAITKKHVIALLDGVEDFEEILKAARAWSVLINRPPLPSQFASDHKDHLQIWFNAALQQYSAQGGGDECPPIHKEGE